MVSWAVVRGNERDLDAGSVQLLGAEQGAIHLDVSLVSLVPGEVLDPEWNPYEESFYVLGGTPVVEMEGQSYLLKADDFGYVPVALGHRWSNQGSEHARYLRVRSPQPRDFGSAALTGSVDMSPWTKPSPVDPTHPSTRLVGHFDRESLPPPGPLQMRGFRSTTARNVGLLMLVDEVVGAVHHTLFMVGFTSTDRTMTLGGQHYHPFEEIYYITEGVAIAHLEDESHPIEAGDLVFAGVNALHGFSSQTDQPVRWIEAQAPAPPRTDASFFPSQWFER